MPVYHSGKLSGTDRPDYTLPLRPQTRDLTLPLAPKNLMVTSPFIIGKTDIRWDNPRLLPENNGLNIVGVNVYRATDSPEAPYIKLNDTPVGALFYRDETIEQHVIQEDATPTLVWTGEPDGKTFVYAQNKPLIKPGTNGVTSDRPQDVVVEIDDGDGNFLETPAYAVNGRTGMIQLIDGPTWNYQVQQIIPPRLPTPPNGRVRISYYWLKHSVISALNQRIYYKATTVVQNPDGSFIETPLAEVSARSTFDMEMIDYIWREAIRRNRWLLEQTGERVKVFIRKWMGLKCESYEDKYGQSHSDCLTCFGSGIVGGYEGPYDIIIAPPETEKMVELGDMGLHIRYDWATWSTDYPILNERDIIVRPNNERYIVGPVNYQGSRGATYQQHFTISHIDELDIRYKVPITGGETSVPPAWDAYRQQTAPTQASPIINNKPEIPEPRIIRGRTVTFENITW